MLKLLAVAFLSMLPAVHAADDAEAKPGFLGRLWQSTKNGASRTLDATRSVGKKTTDIVKSPFQRGEKTDAEGKAGWRRLAMTMQFDPPVVKAGETRMIDVTIAVTNKGKNAVQLDFPTSQRIEVLVNDQSGKTLSRWSDDQRVEKEPGFLLINPGERIEYRARISTRDMRAGQTFIVESFFAGYDQVRTRRTIVPQP
jgi:hypothetical protein